MKKGIDVSKWQGAIDWEKAKAGGVEFAILRAGYGQGNVDETFARNASECMRLGIPFGVYWFSYAYTVERARKEAVRCIETIAPYALTYPVAFDFEYDSVNYAEGFGVKITKQLASGMARAFLEEIEAAGYTPMLYTNADYLSRYFDAGLAEEYDVWLAQWPENPDLNNPPMECAMWQYSSSGTVSGIDGRVDMNVCYKDYETEVNKVIYHNRDEIAEKAEWGLGTFDKLVAGGWLRGEGPTEHDAVNDYSLSRDMLRILVILDRAGVFGG